MGKRSQACFQEAMTPAIHGTRSCTHSLISGINSSLDQIQGLDSANFLSLFLINGYLYIHIALRTSERRMKAYYSSTSTIAIIARDGRAEGGGGRGRR